MMMMMILMPFQHHRRRDDDDDAWRGDRLLCATASRTGRRRETRATRRGASSLGPFCVWSPPLRAKPDDDDGAMRFVARFTPKIETLSLSLFVSLSSRGRRGSSRCCSILLSSTKDFDDDTRGWYYEAPEHWCRLLDDCSVSLFGRRDDDDGDDDEENAVDDAPRAVEGGGRERGEEASTRLVRATTAEEEDFVGERRLPGKKTKTTKRKKTKRKKTRTTPCRQPPR